MLKENKMAYLSGLGPASLSYKANAASYLLSSGFKPCNNMKKATIGGNTPQILKRN